MWQFVTNASLSANKATKLPHNFFSLNSFNRMIDSFWGCEIRKKQGPKTLSSIPRLMHSKLFIMSSHGRFYTASAIAERRKRYLEMSCIKVDRIRWSTWVWYTNEGHNYGCPKFHMNFRLHKSTLSRCSRPLTAREQKSAQPCKVFSTILVRFLKEAWDRSPFQTIPQNNSKTSKNDQRLFPKVCSLW